MAYINQEVIQNFPFETFHKREPFPWFDFSKFLTEEGFQALYRDFPLLKQFEYHENIDRKGQRSHDRYYLAYEKSIYHSSKDHQGIISHHELKPSWQEFIAELEGKIYKTFISNSLEVKDFQVRYAWHVGKKTNEVSPHKDSENKVGTHIFYFNTDEDWKDEWGGQILVLGGKTIPGNAPDFKDFIQQEAISNMNNHSFLFKNTPNAWHGVKALFCPSGKYRRLFNVIFNNPVYSNV